MCVRLALLKVGDKLLVDFCCVRYCGIAHFVREVINAALEAAGGTKFVMDSTDSQKDAYWTSSENEASSGNAATINPFTGELHGGVMKSKEKKVRFIFAF